MEQGAAKIEKEPWVVESEYDAANLAEFLVDPDRRTPAFVLTVPEESEDPVRPLLDPMPLTADTLGIAKVIVLPFARYQLPRNAIRMHSEEVRVLEQVRL